MFIYVLSYHFQGVQGGKGEQGPAGPPGFQVSHLKHTEDGLRSDCPGVNRHTVSPTTQNVISEPERGRVHFPRLTFVRRFNSTQRSVITVLLDSPPQSPISSKPSEYVIKLRSLFLSSRVCLAPQEQLVKPANQEKG